MDQIQDNELSLRQMIATDRQQMSSLQEQLGRLNDRVTELQHGGAGGGKTLNSVNDRLSKLEAQVLTMQSGGMVAPGIAPGGIPTAPGAGVTPGTPGPAIASTAPPGAAVPPPVAAPGWRANLSQEIANSANSSEPGAKLYRAALNDMQAGKYNSAIVKFAQLQHSYPKSPLGEGAEYFSANALYETGKYDQSVLQFNDLVMRYPKGRFASEALLREAQAFLKLNDRIDARLTLQKLIQDHPGTEQASAANAMMKDLVSD